MVDIGDKPVTDRRAEARGAIRMQPGTLEVVSRGEARKGDVLGVARVAGIMAAKRTSELIPLCHPLTLDDVRVEIEVERSLPGLRVTAAVRTTGRTGAEMEALTAVAVTLLTIYDMTKSVDREMVITDIVLTAKSGGVRHD
jgi:cyclic pyranopterin phosphate synthase